MSALVRYEAMCAAVQAAATVDEAKDIADKATALKAYARQHNNPELTRQITEIQIRAKRRIGELAAELETLEGDNFKRVPSVGRASKRETLAAAGLSKSEANRCEQLARVPAAVLEHFQADGSGWQTRIDQALREVVAARSR